MTDTVEIVGMPDMPRMNVWIAPDFLEWPAEVEYMEPQPRGPVRRGYELWDNADEIVRQPTLTRVQRENIVLTLKRCIRQREGLLTTLYGLRSFPGQRADALEVLESLGLVRPHMARILLAIRNEIEHEDALPPDPERCRELSEFVWYFLRSTDFFVRGRLDTVVFHMKSRRNWREVRVDLSINDKPWAVGVMARIAPSSLSLEPRADWFSLVNAMVEKVGDRQRRWAKASSQPKATLSPGAEDMFTSGDLRGPFDQFVPLFRTFFAAQPVMFEGS